MVKEAIVMCMTSDSVEKYIQLCSPLNVTGYAVSVLSFHGDFDPEDAETDSLFLCSNICKESYLNEGIAPILFQINKKSVFEFSSTIWYPVNRNILTSLKLYILNSKGERPSFRTCHFTCSLVFVPVK